MKRKTLLCVCVLLLCVTSGFGQKKFKVSTECAYGCGNPNGGVVATTFSYADGLSITVQTRDSQVLISKGKFYKEFLGEEDRKTNMVVNSQLKTVLLAVQEVGLYCIDKNIDSGSYIEKGKFRGLARLRQYFKL